MPKLLPAVHIEGVNLVMFGGDEKHIVDRSPYGEPRHVKRLRINVALYSKRSTFTERLRIYVRHSEHGLLGVGSGAVTIVVIGGYSDLPPGNRGIQEYGECAAA